MFGDGDESTYNPSFFFRLLRQFLGGATDADVVEDEASGSVTMTREEAGCMLWDLCASEQHAALLCDSMMLPVVHATLKEALARLAATPAAAAAGLALLPAPDAELAAISQGGSGGNGGDDDARVAEIALGILGNVAAHAALSEQLTTTAATNATGVDALAAASDAGGAAADAGPDRAVDADGGSGGDGHGMGGGDGCGMGGGEGGGGGVSKESARCPGLVATVVWDVLAGAPGADDVHVLCEACRLAATAAEQPGREAWLLQLERAEVLDQLAWVAANTLRPDLFQQSVDTLAAVCRQRPDAAVRLAVTNGAGLLDVLALVMDSYWRKNRLHPNVADGGSGLGSGPNDLASPTGGREVRMGGEGGGWSPVERDTGAEESVVGVGGDGGGGSDGGDGGPALMPTGECVESLLHLVEDMACVPAAEVAVVAHLPLVRGVCRLLACGEAGERVPEDALRTAAALQGACGPFAVRDPELLLALLRLDGWMMDDDTGDTHTGDTHIGSDAAHQQQQEEKEEEGQRAPPSHPFFVVLAAGLADLLQAMQRHKVQQAGVVAGPESRPGVGAPSGHEAGRHSVQAAYADSTLGGAGGNALLAVLADAVAWQPCLQAIASAGGAGRQPDPAGVYVANALLAILRAWLDSGPGGGGDNGGEEAEMRGRVQRQLRAVEAVLEVAGRSSN